MGCLLLDTPLFKLKLDLHSKFLKRDFFLKCLKLERDERCNEKEAAYIWNNICFLKVLILLITFNRQKL